MWHSHYSRESRGPLFNLIIADGLVFGRTAFLKIPEVSQY